MDELNKLNPFPFSPNAAAKPMNILKGETIEQFLKEKGTSICNFGMYDLYSYGIYKYMGWRYDFRPFLKRFLIRQDSWIEVWAINKTAARKLTFGKISEIHEIPKQ